MQQPLHILIVEDCEKDRELVLRELERGGYQITSERVETAAAFKKALDAGGWDVIIADYNLPAFSAPEALRLLQESKIDLPFIIVSGTIGEEEAVAAMKAGAHDYILKHSLARLVPVVQREMREARARQERRHAQEAFSRLAAIVESSGDAIVGKTLEGIITSWNLGAERLFGYSAEEIVGRSVTVLLPPDRLEEETQILNRLRQGINVDHFETVRLHKDGRHIDVSVTISPVKDRDGVVIGAAKIARDITERRRAETSVAALSKLGQNLAAASTPEDAARVIGKVADELFTWDAFTLDMYVENEDQILSVLHVDTMNGQKQELASAVADGTPDAKSRRTIDCGAELILCNDVAAGGKRQSPVSLMKVPVRNQTRVIGIISIQSYRPKAYDHRSLRTLQTLADYCGGALERMRAREELRESREQLRALAAHLQSIREEERKLITREIHDELGQSLTGFKMDLAWIRNRMQSEDWNAIRQPILDKMVTMGKLLDGTATLMRRICTELRPGVLDDLGLTAAIEWQAREYQQRTGIVCALQMGLGDLNVDPDRSTALFRIFQEILTNVARHAHATRVEAVMEKVGPNVLLTVKDNGRGIKKNEIAGAKSLGLLGMRERAVILGGEVEINGVAGKGTTVRVKVPLPELSASSAEAEIGTNAGGAAQALLARENLKTKKKAIH